MIGKNYCIWLLKITKTRITFFDLFGGRSKSYFRFLLSARFLGDIKMKSFKQIETTLKNIFVV